MKKHNLVYLISVIFILLVGMSMTGCAVTGGTLITAAYKGQTTVIKDLLDKGADVDERGGCGLWSVGAFGATPLLCAAVGGHMETVKELIAKGADVNAIASRPRSTPLIAAAIAGHPNIATLLIEKGADIDYAMTELKSGGWGIVGVNGLKLLERLTKKQQLANQPTASQNLTKEDMEKIVQAAVEKAAKPKDKESKDGSAVQSDIDEIPTIKAKPNKNAYAIVIGIENYRQKLPKADFAVSDAKLMSEYLSKAMGYPEENIVTLINENATKSDFEKYFEKWLLNNAEKDSTVFIYYSGHGAPNPKTGDAYLVPYDGDPSFIDQTGYSLKRMYDTLGKLPAKNIIVALDSCFSGAGGRSVIAEGTRPLVMNLQNAITSSANMTVIAAASGAQVSSTYKEKGHGLFTYFMLKGIKNEDVVTPDGSIKIDDLFGYLKPQVERIARKQYNNEQTPQLIAPEKKKVFLRE